MDSTTPSCVCSTNASRLRELDARRETIVKSIEEQAKLTPELAAAIAAADTKARLEDLYLPYKPKRRTKAQIARDAGLEPLAMLLLAHPETHTRRGGDAVRRRREGCAGCGRCPRGRAMDPGRAGGRGRGADRLAAPAAVGPWRVDVHRRAGRRKRASSSRTTSTRPSRCAACRHTGRSRCSAGGTKASCA